jgi:hypothetical protein
MKDSTRRVFLKHSGVVVGAGAIGWSGPAALASSSRGLSPGRRATYASLVATLAAANSLPSDSATVSDATQRFESWYSSSLDGTRRCVEIVLDEIGAAAGERAAVLRSWRAEPKELNTGQEDPATLRRRLAACHALEFASPPYGGSPDKPAPLAV